MRVLVVLALVAGVAFVLWKRSQRTALGGGASASYSTLAASAAGASSTPAPARPSSGFRGSPPAPAMPATGPAYETHRGVGHF